MKLNDNIENLFNLTAEKIFSDMRTENISSETEQAIESLFQEVEEQQLPITSTKEAMKIFLMYLFPKENRWKKDFFRKLAQQDNTLETEDFLLLKNQYPAGIEIISKNRQELVKVNTLKEKGEYDTEVHLLGRCFGLLGTNHHIYNKKET